MIIHDGVWKAFSSRYFTAAACFTRGTGVNSTPAWPMFFCCELNPPTIAATWPISSAHWPSSRPYNSSRSSYGSPSLVVVAGISMSMTRWRFFMPRVVDAIASSSPTASVSSPGSDPRAFAVEKRSHGVLSCSRAHWSSVFFSCSGDFADGMGL